MLNESQFGHGDGLRSTPAAKINDTPLSQSKLLHHGMEIGIQITPEPGQLLGLMGMINILKPSRGLLT